MMMSANDHQRVKFFGGSGGRVYEDKYFRRIANEDIASMAERRNKMYAAQNRTKFVFPPKKLEHDAVLHAPEESQMMPAGSLHTTASKDMSMTWNSRPFRPSDSAKMMSGSLMDDQGTVMMKLGRGEFRPEDSKHLTHWQNPQVPHSKIVFRTIPKRPHRQWPPQDKGQSAGKVTWTNAKQSREIFGGSEEVLARAHQDSTFNSIAKRSMINKFGFEVTSKKVGGGGGAEAGGGGGARRAHSALGLSRTSGREGGREKKGGEEEGRMRGAGRPAREGKERERRGGAGGEGEEEKRRRREERRRVREERERGRKEEVLKWTETNRSLSNGQTGAVTARGEPASEGGATTRRSDATAGLTDRTYTARDTTRSRRPETAGASTQGSRMSDHGFTGRESERGPLGAWTTGSGAVGAVGDGGLAEGRKWEGSRIGRAVVTSRRYYMNEMLGTCGVSTLMAHEPDRKGAIGAVKTVEGRGGGVESARGTHPFGKGYASVDQIRRRELVPGMLQAKSPRGEYWILMGYSTSGTDRGYAARGSTGSTHGVPQPRRRLDFRCGQQRLVQLGFS